MVIKCIIHGHAYVKIDTIWINDAHDEMLASNYGGSIRAYSYDVYQCGRCLSEKRVATGNYTYI